MTAGGRQEEKPEAIIDMSDSPLSKTRPKRAAAATTAEKIGASLKEQEGKISEEPAVAKKSKRADAGSAKKGKPKYKSYLETVGNTVSTSM